MKKLILSVLFGLPILWILSSCGNQTNESKTENTVSAPQNAEIYQCPMKCEGEKTYDKPGVCPVCNMDLKKVEAQSETHNDSTGHEHHDH